MQESLASRGIVDSMAAVKKPVLLLVFLALVFGATGAQAITYGQPDGNRHPNVGAMIRFREADDIYPADLYRIVCSGSLIAPTVFLTASHCTSFVQSFDPPYNDVWVTFDPHPFPTGNDPLITNSTLPVTAIHGTICTGPLKCTNPLYSQRQSDPGDIAVIILDHAPPGIDPVVLPDVGLLDDMRATGELKSALFTNVGYGTEEPVPGPGGVSNAFHQERRYSVSSFWAMTSTWLLLNQNKAAGSAGTCSGDSGGPQFLGAGANETNTQVSITIKGDAFCFATNWVYRLDTPQAREFLDDFVTLP